MDLMLSSVKLLLIYCLLNLVIVIEFSGAAIQSDAYRRLLRTVYRNTTRKAAVTASNIPPEGSIRLTGGQSRSEGNVEIFHAGRWGSVCDDEFDMAEGDVICRSLGFRMGADSVTSNGFFGPGKKIIWMDNLYCKGNEHELHHCPFDGWKIHDCESNEVAGVVCKESSITPILTIPSSHDHHHHHPALVLVRHPAHPPTSAATSFPSTISSTTTATTGFDAVWSRLHHEERDDHSNANQVINSQENLLQPDLQVNHNMPDAAHAAAAALHVSPLPSSSPLQLTPPPPPPYPSSRSAFRRLPLLHPHRPPQPHQPPPPPSTTITTTLPTARTTTTNASFSSSNHDQDVIRPSTRNSSQRQQQKFHAVAEERRKLSRATLESDLQSVISEDQIAVRLTGGRNQYEGRVEIGKDGQWIPVCGDGFDLKTGAVVCHHLNYGYAYHTFATSGPLDESLSFESAPEDLVIRLQCHGKEKLLSDCRRKLLTAKKCSPNQDNWASVICTQYLPDLVPDAAELESSVFLEDKQMMLLQCASEENCLSSSAMEIDRSTHEWLYESRRLLRFTAKIGNFGTADFRPLLHKASWNWHSCHKHYHSMETFAHFDILSPHAPGIRVAEGHKASFCLEDNDCAPGVRPKYKCANFGDQGISPGCKDIYLSKLDCQWIDITDLEAGVYVLKMTINPEMKVAESSFDNNSAVCTLVYDLSNVRVHNCTLAPI